MFLKKNTYIESRPRGGEGAVLRKNRKITRIYEAEDFASVCLTGGVGVKNHALRTLEDAMKGLLCENYV